MWWTIGGVACLIVDFFLVVWLIGMHIERIRRGR